MKMARFPENIKLYDFVKTPLNPMNYQIVEEKKRGKTTVYTLQDVSEDDRVLTIGADSRMTHNVFIEVDLTFKLGRRQMSILKILGNTPKHGTVGIAYSFPDWKPLNALRNHKLLTQNRTNNAHGSPLTAKGVAYLLLHGETVHYDYNDVTVNINGIPTNNCPKGLNYFIRSSGAGVALSTDKFQFEKSETNEKGELYITGYHGCSCHPFRNWKESNARHKQKFTLGAKVRNRCTGEYGEITEVSGNNYYLVDYTFEDKASDNQLEHAAMLLSQDEKICLQINN